jgi:exopolysaccharide biosynthesis polyprenyl glycosylphosphotransferase
MKTFIAASQGGWSLSVGHEPRRGWTKNKVLSSVLFASVAGDVLCVLGILHLAFLRSHAGEQMPPAPPVLGWLFAGLGAAIFIGTFGYYGIYAREFLLDRRKQTTYLIEAWAGSSVLFLAATLLSGSDLVTFPFAAMSVLVLLLLLLGWRVLFQRVMLNKKIIELLRERIVILGWSENVARLARQSWEVFTYPCEIVGYVEIALQWGVPPSEATPTVPCLGTKKDLGAILEHHRIDVAFLAQADMATEDVFELARLCQTEMVEFKVVPSCFPALLSGMHVEWVSGVPILGTDRLRMNRLHIRVQKRALDVLGALVGLLLAGPIIGFFALLVYLESPGPVFYRQRRLGRQGRPFEMIKIRSMRLDAEKSGQPGWTVSNDPRRLKIGAFMRRWNIDELPQFWNVLKGEMSLVGPRPERPEIIVNLKHEIEHYNLRHSVKPGLTGWAQVNGFRGDTDLTERIRHDLYYIDHWSVLLDVQTMVMTLFKQKNAC